MKRERNVGVEETGTVKGKNRMTNETWSEIISQTNVAITMQILDSAKARYGSVSIILWNVSNDSTYSSLSSRVVSVPCLTVLFINPYSPTLSTRI